jgi:hypothetical protein
MRAIREIKSLSISEARWLAYATAGVASALGLSPSAEAEIHYSGLLNIGMEHYNSVFLPLTNGVSLNFMIFYRSYPYAYFRITGAGRASALAAYTFVYARVLQRLEKGDSIRSCDSCGNPRHFGSVAGMPGRGGIMGLYITGNFYGTTSGIIGFRFNVGNGTQYGWARIRGPDPFNHYHYEIKDYAWADSGERIVAGQRSSTELGSISEIGSLGLLATGARGLELWRRVRSETAH